MIQCQADPGATTIDAFTIDWNTFGYVPGFPAFSLLWRVLQKFQPDGVRGVLIILNWPTQS